MLLLEKILESGTCVYWERKGLDDLGNVTFAPPVDVPCRWEEAVAIVMMPNGDQVVSHSQVYVDRRVTEQGYLFHGTLADLTDENDPKKNTGSWAIRKFEEIYDLYKEDYLRTAYL